jgi:primosomal protein N'
VIDEEHDSSLNMVIPRYNARDAAIYYASLLRKVLLYATPSIETYYNERQICIGGIK